jgi:hypothetical protein
MIPETKAKLIAKRQEVTEKLIAQGIDCQQVRFMVMSAGANPEGLLEDQIEDSKGIDPELIEITNQARAETPPYIKDNRTDAEVQADTAAILAADLAREKWCE